MSKPSTGNRKLDSLRDRAASKIIWGENEDSVYQFLRKEGVAPELANQFVTQANRERAAMLRRKSLIRLTVGLVGVLICGGLLLWIPTFSDIRYAGRGSGRLFIALIVGLFISGGYSLKHAWIVLSGRSLGSAMEDGT